MDTTMGNGNEIRPTHSRKRSVRDLEAEDQRDEDLYISSTLQEDKPMKRLQNRHGEAIKREPIQYNAQRFLNQLAFTRFYVTSNFSNFNPISSFVMLCMVSEQNELYRALCQILPSLHQVSPTLQALAVTTGYISPNAMTDQALLRIVPLVTTAGVEVNVVEAFEQFRQEVGGDCLAVIDPNGNCVWTSTEFLNDTASNAHGQKDLQSLQESLMAVFTSNPGDVAMGNG